MSDWTGYAVADFIPFTAEVYFRLVERVSEAWWPLHPLALGVGLAAAALALVGRGHIAGGMVAAALAWTGATFLIGAYAQLNWAGAWFGRGFVVAGALLALFAITQPHGKSACRRLSIPGAALAALGVVAYPLIAPLAGRGWLQSEVFGIHPDPTAVAALGIALLILRGWRLWLAALVPLLWCLFSALTLQVLQAPWASILYAVVGVALFGMLRRSLADAGSGKV